MTLWDGNHATAPGHNGRRSDSAGKVPIPGMVALSMAPPVAGNRPLFKAIGYSLGFALLWAVLAVVRPSTTFHLAPLLVAAAVPTVYRMQGGRSRPVALRLAAAGVGIAVVITFVLGVAGLLDGPSLLPFGGAVDESLLGAAVGGALGLVVAGWPRPAQST